MVGYESWTVLGRRVKIGGFASLNVRFEMPPTSAKPETKPPSGFDELDRVMLKEASAVEGRALAPGFVGTVVFCHGSTAYEVEFDGIHDVFGVPAEYLDKL